MRITDTLVNVIRRWKIKMISENEMLVGYASLTFDNVFVCNSISVIWNLEKEKYYIRMPKHVLHDSKTRDTFFAINNEFRRKMENAINKEMMKHIPNPIDEWKEVYDRYLSQKKFAECDIP